MDNEMMVKRESRKKSFNFYGEEAFKEKFA